MSTVPLRRPRAEALLIASLLVLAVIADLVTMFAARAKPVNRKDFSEQFFSTKDLTGNLPYSDPWPDVDGWFLGWFAAIEVVLLIGLLTIAVQLAARRQVPWFAPWAAAGFMVFAISNVAIPFGSAIEWERFPALYASAGIAVAVAVTVGVAMVRARRPESAG